MRLLQDQAAVLADLGTASEMLGELRWQNSGLEYELPVKPDGGDKRCSTACSSSSR